MHRSSAPLLGINTPSSSSSSSSSHSSQSFLQLLKRFDVYRSIPSDHLSGATTAGAMISIVTGVILLILFISEFISFIRVDTRHELFVDHPVAIPPPSESAASFFSWDRSIKYSEESEQMKINFNITLPGMACALTNLVVQDVLGTELDVYSQIAKYRTDSNGQLKFHETTMRPLLDERYDGTIPEEQQHEGCQVVGHIKVKKVPGNFHFVSTNQPDLLQLFFGRTHPPTQRHLNTSHVINELYFGDSLELTNTGLETAIAPLNGGSKWIREGEAKNGNDKSFEYFIKVIPTEYQPLYGVPIKTYQYVSNSNEIIGRMRMPSIFFRYEVEPVTVRFREVRTSFSHFLINCCAIIGGMVATMGIVNMTVKSAVTALKVTPSKGTR